MDIMDPFTSELLSAPGAAGQATEFESDDAYLRAIGALPPRRPRAPASVDHPATLLPSSLMLPSSCVIQPAVEASKKRAAPEPVSDVPSAAPKNPAKRPRTRCPYLPDYDADIDFNLREKERNATQRPSPDYLRTVQGGRMCERTRADLVVWMDELAQHHRLAPGTLHRAVSYVDRVLSARALSARGGDDHKLRLLCAAAVFTAAKYEDRSAVLRLNAADIAKYCGFAGSKEVTAMEREMLATLRYELGGPTAHTFVDHFTRNSRGERNMEVRRVAHRLAHTSLLDYGCLRFLPSAVAATALFLARLIVDPAGSQEFFEDLTGYKPEDLIEGMQSLL
uniref:Uncharacterized protein n=1 Tax=Avena sativa TaxID=4498 RepID=A0ACD5XZY8_AVESA